MANRTLVHTYLATVVLSGGLSLGCGKDPGDVNPSPPPPPVVLAVQSLSPASGSIYGPTTVTIVGSGFDDHAIVRLDGEPVNPIHINSTLISFVAPARIAGRVPVLVANGDGETVVAPAFTYRAAPLHVFYDATGFATSDLRDAQDHIVRADTDGYFIWGEDGTAAKDVASVDGTSIKLKANHICACEFEVRFGTENGERRAYLTADWGHDNPGTVVDLAVTGGTLVVRRSSRYPPGSYTLSGIVTEATPAGDVPIVGIKVYFGTRTGWLEAVTDPNGFYQFGGLYNGGEILQINSPGHQAIQATVSINGDTIFNVRLTRR